MKNLFKNKSRKIIKNIKYNTKEIKNSIIPNNKLNQRKIPWNKLHTEDYEKYGYEVQYNKETNEYLIYDKINNTPIKFESMYSKKNRLIDITNNNKSFYNMNDVLMIYESIPTPIKKIIPSITFKNNTYKDEDGIDPLCTGTTNRNTLDINIYPIALNVHYKNRGNITQTMYHEVGHVIDLYIAQDPRYIEISSSKKWRDAVEADYKLQRKLYVDKYGTDVNFVPEKSSIYGRSNSKENWAESFSMVMFEFMDNKEMAILENYDGINENFDRWIQKHKNKYKFIKGLLEQWGF